jgi:hypothetical protein
MTLEQTVERELEWRQPKALSRHFQLMEGDGEIATLRFQSSSGSLATGEYGGNQWTFKRTGFFSPKISVRAPGSDADLAGFSPEWMGGGWVTFSSGRRLHLRRTNFWGTAWAFEGEDGAAAVRLSAHHGLFKLGGVATVAKNAASLSETPVLLLLMWYVLVLMNEDAAAGAVVAAGS